MLAFKIYISRTSEQQFRYYLPSAEEAETERSRRINEKGTKSSEVEKRFLHPALQADKLFTIMVHKQQEGLARDVLSAYPWFAGKHERTGVQIKAVREVSRTHYTLSDHSDVQENLEYDPERDGPRDEAHQAEWDLKSVASTDMLGGKSALSAPGSPSLMSRYPLPGRDSSPTTAFNSHVKLPMDNPSTDQLLPGSERAESRLPRRQGSRPYPGHYATQSDVALSPLLDQNDSTPYGNRDLDSIPYPPSAYNQPPLGYTPPTLRRTATDRTDDSDQPVGRTRWDDGGDMGDAAAGRGYGAGSHAQPYGGYGYDNPYAATAFDMSRGGSGNDTAGRVGSPDSLGSRRGQERRDGGARNGDQW
jgi:hypothetical protein